MANMQKLAMYEELCLVFFFFKFHKKLLSTIQAVESATPPEKYEAGDSMVCMVLTFFLIKPEKKQKIFLKILGAIFNKIHLVSKMPICTKSSKDID